MPPMRSRNPTKEELEKLKQLVNRDAERSDGIHRLIDLKCNLKAWGMKLKANGESVTKNCLDCGILIIYTIKVEGGRPPIRCPKCSLNRKRHQAKMLWRRKYGQNGLT